MPRALNAASNSVDPIARMISNFAATPFELDGRRYRVGGVLLAGPQILR